MTRENMTSFGEYLRRLREEAGLPLRKVAAELDIDPSLLAKIERNERKPTKQMIALIAKIFKEDEHQLTIAFLSDQIVYQVIYEADGMEALKVAERKVKYMIRATVKKKPG